MNNLSLSTMNNNNTTTVSNVFIDEFMPLANGEFTKIYLYLFKMYFNGKLIYQWTVSLIFSIRQNQILCVHSAIGTKVGVLIASTDSTGRQITGITFCNLDSASGSTPNNSSAQLNSNQMLQTIYLQIICMQNSLLIYIMQPLLTQKFLLHRIPMKHADPRSAYTPKQLEDLSEQEDFSMLLYAAQTYLGSVLNSSDASVIAYLYDSLQFSWRTH